MIISLSSIVATIDVNLVCYDEKGLFHYTLEFPFRNPTLEVHMEKIIDCMENCLGGHISTQQRPQIVHYYLLSTINFTDHLNIKLYQRLNRFVAWENELVVYKEPLYKNLERCVNRLKDDIKFWEEVIRYYEDLFNIFVKMILFLILIVVVVVI